MAGLLTDIVRCWQRSSAMPLIIFMLGMFVAAISAIFIYGYLGVPPSDEKSWVDYLFWGIIFASLLPLLIQDILLSLKAIKKYFTDFCQSHTTLCH